MIVQRATRLVYDVRFDARREASPKLASDHIQFFRRATTNPPQKVKFQIANSLLAHRTFQELSKQTSPANS